jgi:hypothetical protein
MRSAGTGVLVAGAFLALLLPPRAARACGPGVHIRQADRVLDRLAAEDEEWAALAAEPLARAYLHVGTIAPDIGWAVSGLGFGGHDLRLSYHLLDRAETTPHRLFALGHLAHQGADPACETFFTGTFLASAPIGLYDLLDGYDDAEAESEGLIEVFGDLVLGDYDAVVDLLYDFWGDGDAAKERAREIIGWYCAEGAAFAGVTTDCAAVIAGLEETVSRVDSFVGGLDREGARAFLHSLIDRPLPQLADVFASGALTPLLGDDLGAPSAVVNREIARFKAGPLVDPGVWELYDAAFADLGPSFSLDRLALRTTGFPAWDPNSIICGNVQTMMRFLPDDYDVRPGFLVDEVAWTDDAGAPVAAVTEALRGATLRVRIRWFAALPMDGTVRLDVRRDRPGLDPAGDDLVATTTAPFAADPQAYVTTPRSELTLPFVAAPDGALGFYVEVAFAPAGEDVAAARPTFTTSWDRLWRITDAPLDRPVVQDNFGTYGHWPPSLPVAAAPVAEGLLFAAARVPPAGTTPIPGASFALEGTAMAPLTAGANGVAVFDRLAPGDATVAATAPLHVAAGPATASVPDGGRAWAWVPLHPVPQVALGGAWVAPDGEGCVPFRFERAPFDGQARSWLARPVDAAGADLGPEADVGGSGRGAACPAAPLADGDEVAVTVRARYRDDSPGAEGTSPPARVDATPPVVAAVTAAADNTLGCLPEDVPAPWSPAVRVAVSYDEPHAPVVAVGWRLAPSGVWQDVPFAQDGPGALAFSLGEAQRAGGARLYVRLTNAAGLTADAAPAPLPVWGEERRCAPPAPDVLEPGPDAGPDAAASDGAGPAPDAPAEPDAAGGPGEDAPAPGPDGAGPDGDPLTDAAGGGGGSGGGSGGGGGGGCAAAGARADAVPLLPLAVALALTLGGATFRRRRRAG